MKFIQSIIRFFSIASKPYPNVGDKVKVAIGFNDYQKEGVVCRVIKPSEDAPDGSGYCWIDQYTKDGKWYHSFTASFSYCCFEYL